MPKKRQALRCKARKTNGEPCPNWAMIGTTVCHAHGGKAKQVKAAAAQRVAEEKARRAVERYSPTSSPVTDPLSALLSLAGEVTAFKDFLGRRVSQLRAEEWRYRGEHAEQLRAEIALYERALDRTARVLTDINRLDLEARLVRVREEQARVFISAFERVLDRLELSAEQRARVPEAVQAELRAIAGGAA